MCKSACSGPDGGGPPSSRIGEAISLSGAARVSLEKPRSACLYTSFSNRS